MIVSKSVYLFNHIIYNNEEVSAPGDHKPSLADFKLQARRECPGSNASADMDENVGKVRARYLVLYCSRHIVTRRRDG
jgi:hypothetical protein